MRSLIFLLSFSLGLILSASEILEPLLQLYPLEQDLAGYNRAGKWESEGEFARPSPAWDDAFNRIERNQPRFTGRGLLLENGTGGPDLSRGSKNYLDPASASLDDAVAVTVTGEASRCDGVQKNGLRLRGQLQLPPLPYPHGGTFLFSFYARNGSITLQHHDLPPQTITAGPEWQRHWISITAPTPPEARPLLLTLDSGNGSIELDAMMLEGNANFYLRRRVPSSWLPGGEKRAAELLLIGCPPGLAADGAVSLRFTARGFGDWNALLSSGSWQPELALSVRDYGKRLEAQLWKSDIKARLPEALADGREYALLLRWNATTAELFLDGMAVGSCELPPPAERKLPLNLAIGGSSDQSSPNIRAEGMLRDVALWRSTADPAAIAAVPTLRALLPASYLQDLVPATAFGIEDAPVTLRWRTARKVRQAEAALAPAPATPLSQRGDILSWTFTPAQFMPGDYRLRLHCTYADGSTETLDKLLRLSPARRPWKNTQVCTWNYSDPELAGLGVTLGGLFRLSAAAVDANTANGLYSQYNWVFLGEARPHHPEEWGHDTEGKPIFPSILAPAVRESVVHEATSMAEKLHGLPAVKMLVINTERHAGSAHLDFSPGVVSIARERFGLDLTPWFDAKLPEHRRFQPLGRLALGPVPDIRPAHGIIAADHPLYAFHRWWHSAEGGSDVVTNDLMAQTVNREHPDLLTAKDPIARRPPLRSHRHVRVAQDWLYYPELYHVVAMTEQLQALSRGLPDMCTSTMPQFLLKAGMAAPFNGMPSADMFREAAWLASSRRTRLITFWNANNAFSQGDQHTAQQLAAMTPDELKKAKAWDPGLRPAFLEVARQLWEPFGALLPEWRDAPRRVAVVHSLAGLLFGDVRWFDGSTLPDALARSGVPYDLLFDEDFENPALALDNYDLIVLPALKGLPALAVSRLRQAAAGGTRLIADPAFAMAAALPEARVLAANQAAAGRQQELLQEELRLLEQHAGRTDAPAYVEAMEELSRQRPAAFAELEALLAGLPRLPWRLEQGQAFWNMLELDGASYLIAVNDLRVAGPLYGRYGKVREKGLPQRVVFAPQATRFRHAWDLTASQPVPADRLILDLAPGSGRIIMLSDTPLGTLRLRLPKTAARGTFFPVEADLPSAGAIPAEVIFSDPAGQRSSHSHYTLIRNGSLRLRLPAAWNAPAGRWQVEIRELATGQRCSATLDIH